MAKEGNGGSHEITIVEGELARRSGTEWRAIPPGGMGRHIQFSALHAVAKARASGNLEQTRHALKRSMATRTDHRINRFSSMA
jgi:hypothetical protein